MRHRSAALGAALRPLLDAGAVPGPLNPELADTLVSAASANRLTGALRRALPRPSDSPIATHLGEVQIDFTAAALAALSRASAAIQHLAGAGIPGALDGSPGAIFLVEWGEPAGSQDFGIVVEPDDVRRAAQSLLRRRVPLSAAPRGALTRSEVCRIGGRPVSVLSPLDRLIALSADAERERWSTLDFLLAAALTARRCAPPATAMRGVAVSVLAAEAVFGIETPLRAWAETDAGAWSLARSVAAAFGVEAERLGARADGRSRKLILHQHQAPGDLVMLTAAIRDLKAANPDRFTIDVRTPSPDLWLHNPHLTPLADDDSDVEHLYCEYPLIHRSNQTPVHFIWGFLEFLNERLGTNARPTAFKGDIHLSDGERAAPSLVEQITGADVPFWIVAAGGKADFTIKWWSSARFQEVIDHFRGRLLFVQVGETGHHHPVLDGVLDLRGRTSLRELIRLVHHADGVLTPVSLLMHLAAAVEKAPRGAPDGRACVVVAGGREPAHWEQYPGHAFLHTVGALPCCRTGGCWRSRTLPLGDGDEKDLPTSRCVDVVDALPHCMEMIHAADAIKAIEGYVAGRTVRSPTAAQHARVVPHVTTTPGRPAPAVHTRAVPVTIAVLTRRNESAAVRRCLESIARFCPRDKYRLVVGGNGPSDVSRAYLLEQRRLGHVDRLHESPVDLSKPPMMARMLADIDTPYLWWLDDDAFAMEPTVLERRLELASRAPADHVVWGERWFYRDTSPWSMAPDMYAFIRASSWYRGLPLPGEPGGPALWEFMHGGCWLARMSALRAIDWPDPRMVTQVNDDVLMSVALLQQGYSQIDIGVLGVSAGHEPRA